nr:MAG TPA: hypothetical protein [Caudoviricetes sp.]
MFFIIDASLLDVVLFGYSNQSNKRSAITTS